MKQLTNSGRFVRQRLWDWCRHWNGFCDQPKWRLVAEQLDLPVYQVVAFVTRLEEFANDAGNRGYARGEVGHFSAAEFGIALGMTEGDAARIFAALERPEIGWIAYDHVASFYERNRDSDDDRDASNARKRRSRAGARAMKVLAALAARGRIDAQSRTEIEVRLALPPRVLPDAEFFALVSDIQSAELSTERAEFSTGHNVTAGHNVTGKLLADPGASRVGHLVTPAQSVTVPVEKSRADLAHSVDNSGDGAGGSGEGPAGEELGGAAGAAQAAAKLWMADEGCRLVADRMDVPLPRAEVLAARWLDQQLQGNAVALKTILQAEGARGYVGPRFHTDVTDAVARHVRMEQAKADTQGRLPLGGLQAVKRGGTNG